MAHIFVTQKTFTNDQNCAFNDQLVVDITNMVVRHYLFSSNSNRFRFVV